MATFSGDPELLQDFLAEAGELLASLDNRLVELEKRPRPELLNEIFRGFHTIKGGAGFLNLGAMVRVCHGGETLLDRLRGGLIEVDADVLDAILAATGAVREMFDALSSGLEPEEADPAVMAALERACRKAGGVPADNAPGAAAAAGEEPAAASPRSGAIDWERFYRAVTGGDASAPAQPALDATSAAADAVLNAPLHPSMGRRATDNPAGQGAGGRRPGDAGYAGENSIRVDTSRLDQVLNLSGEIGLTKNRLACLRSALMHGPSDAGNLQALDEAVNQLDLLVGELQSAVMKTRMQPVARLFARYPRMVRDIARQLGKQIELQVSGEDTEIDRTMIEELSDPLVHLIRNALDHAAEPPEERAALGKKETCTVRISAEQIGDQIVIEVADDGRGIRPDLLRRKALERGLITVEEANGMDDERSLQLMFLPGLSTREQVGALSGRGVGMDVVRNNVQRINGHIDVRSAPGEGTSVRIVLPLTLAILPVLLVRLAEQVFALPLALVREIIRIAPDDVSAVSGNATMVLRGQMLPVRSLAGLLDWPLARAPEYGVLVQSIRTRFVLGVDGFVGRDDLVIKPLEGVKPKGIAGATLAGDGSVVLLLDMEELLRSVDSGTSISVFEAPSSSAGSAADKAAAPASAKPEPVHA